MVECGLVMMPLDVGVCKPFVHVHVDGGTSSQAMLPDLATTPVVARHGWWPRKPREHGNNHFRWYKCVCDNPEQGMCRSTTGQLVLHRGTHICKSPGEKVGWWAKQTLQHGSHSFSCSILCRHPQLCLHPQTATPDIGNLLQPLETNMRCNFISALTGGPSPGDLKREMLLYQPNSMASLSQIPQWLLEENIKPHWSWQPLLCRASGKRQQTTRWALVAGRGSKPACAQRRRRSMQVLFASCAGLLGTLLTSGLSYSIRLPERKLYPRLRVSTLGSSMSIKCNL